MGSRRLLISITLLLCWTAVVEAAEWQDRLLDDYGLEVHGFVEGRGGYRLQNDKDEKDMSIGELRLQGDVNRDFGWGILKVKGDLYGDRVEKEVNAELRELNLLFSPLDNTDVKAGRQTLTWGTGDLLFINDLFPKDWESFFIGRDDEYLKAPSDALKVSMYFDPVNIDFVYMPLFANSRYIDGERLSYWNPMLATIAGRHHLLDDDGKNRIFRDDALSVRLFKTLGSTEFALYGYYGYWTTPEGFNPVSGKLVYPQLAVYGASFRKPLLGGIGNVEVGYYDSLQDSTGEDPTIRNSESRLLAGFEREIAANFTGGVQYYLEWMQDYDAYQRSLTPGSPARDEYRHLLTLRLTRMLLNQNLTLSLFVYYSPSDSDSYWRPKIKYKLNDFWQAEAGANLFFGAEDYTFWGQFADNTNAYVALRYNF